jgi:hypothetical protein
MIMNSTKRGTSRGIPLSRIWLEGAKLSDHGFTHGQKFHVEHSAGYMRLTAFRVESVDVPVRKVSGTPQRPIIDLTGELIRSTFTAERVTVEFSTNTIILKG